MKKLYSIYLIAIFLFGISMNMFAQAKVENEKPSDEYDRSSVSIISVSHGGAYQDNLNNAIQGFFVDKFDRNDIATKTLSLQVGEGEKFDEKLDARVNELNIGKEIIARWLDRKSDGTMDVERITARGLYNATDADVIKEAASKVNKIAESGEDIIKNSYVVVIDGKLEKKTSKDKKTGKTSTYYSSDLTSYVYRIDFDRDMLDNIYNNMWVDPSDDAATKSAKLKAWDDMAITMTRVASAHSTGIDSESTNIFTGAVTPADPEAAVNDAYAALLRRLEDKISDWQVKVPIYSTKPITAKIGKKEGLKNGNRFKVYKYVEDEEGNLKMKKRGYIRATTIADNDTIATGESKTSTFYQISGLHMEEGMLINQSNDLKIGVSVEAELGGLAIGNGSVDYLVHISDKGFCQYAMVDFGFDRVKLTASGMDYGKHNFLNVGLGYAYGVPLTRLFEIRPSVGVGIDYLMHDSTGESDSKAAEYSALYVKPALRFSWQVIYPVRIYLQADYSLLFSKGAIYGAFHQESTMMSISRDRGGLGLSLGVRCAF